MFISRLAGLVSSKKQVAPPEFVGAGTVAAAALQGSLTVNYPSGIQSGDLLILCVKTVDTDCYAPSGWTDIYTYNFSYAAYKYYSSGSSVEVTSDGYGIVAAVVFAVRGVKTSSPINKYIAGGTLSGTSLSCKSPTPTVDNCLVFVCIFFKDTGDDDTDNMSNWTNSDLVSITEAIDAHFLRSGTYRAGLAMAYGVKTSAGAISNTTLTADANVSTAMQVTFAVAPLE